MILDDLAALEEQLLLQVEHVTASTEAQLERAGVFAAYRYVHTAYAELLLDPDCGMEALKRALFLQWCGRPLRIWCTG